MPSRNRHARPNWRAHAGRWPSSASPAPSVCCSPCVAFQSYRTAARSLEEVRAAQTQIADQQKKAEQSAGTPTRPGTTPSALAGEAKAQIQEAVRQKTIADDALVAAEAQRILAVAKGGEALARQLSAQAQTTGRLRWALPLSTLLAVESMRRYPSFDADQALRADLALLPRQVGQIQLDQGETHHAHVSRDGRILASVGDRSIQLWNLETRQRTGTVETLSPATVLALSNDGTRIAASVPYGKFGLGVFDSSGTSLTPKPLPAADVLAWSPDNRYLAAAGESPETIVWDTSTFTLGLARAQRC